MAKDLDTLKTVMEAGEEEETNIQLDDVELEETEPQEEIEDSEEDSAHMEKFSAMLRQSLAEEHEAAANYTKRAAKCEKHGMEDAAKLFRDIAEEEVVHAGEFQALMEKYGILNQDAIEQGEQEAEEVLSGEKEEPEIDSDAVPADDAENEAAESINEDIDNTLAVYTIKSLLPSEKDLPAEHYTELQLRNIYASYFMPERDHITPAEIDAMIEKRDNTSVEEIINYLNNTGDMEVTADEANEDASAGTIASAGEAPTVVAGKGVIEAKPTKICEELIALREALK